VAALSLALAVSVIVGASDFLGGVVARRVPPLVVIAASQSLALLLLGVAAAVRGTAPPSLAFVPWAMGAAACGLIGLSALYRGLARGPMGLVAPVAMCSSVIPVVFGLLTGERLRAFQLAGLGLVMAGLASLAVEERRAAPVSSDRWLGLAAMAAMGIGTWVILIRQASRVGDPLWAVLAFRVSELTAIAVVLLARRDSLPSLHGTGRALIAIGILESIGSVLFATVLRVGMISIVAVLGSLYPLVTALAARVFLGERLRASQLRASAVTLAGIAIVLAASA
jgi:drug/metabolite transporter (DMT)-like permease